MEGLSDCGWIQTFTGKRFDVWDPKPELVDIVDIAHSLARESRFSGHTQGAYGYSVAQHSVLVSDYLQSDLKLTGLLHDASEAYLKDLPRPIKVYFRDKDVCLYDKLEDGITRAIAARFGIMYPFPEEIHRVDNLLLCTEARELMSPLHPDWKVCEEHGYPSLPIRIIPWEPELAEANFLWVFQDLLR